MKRKAFLLIVAFSSLTIGIVILSKQTNDDVNMKQVLTIDQKQNNAGNQLNKDMNIEQRSSNDQKQKDEQNQLHKEIKIVPTSSDDQKQKHERKQLYKDMNIEQRSSNDQKQKDERKQLYKEIKIVPTPSNDQKQKHEGYQLKNDIKTVPISSTDLKQLNTVNENTTAIKKGLVKLAHQFAKAKKHVRGTKTADSLEAFEETLTNMLKSFNIDYANLVERKPVPPVSVCPEVNKGMKIGYPLMDTGFVSEECSYAKNLEELITVLFVYEDSQTYDVGKLLNSVRKYNSKIPIIIGAKTSKLVDNVPSSVTNINKISNFSSESNVGKIWNKLVNNVQTKYTLIAHDVIYFNHDARLERLIRMIERLNLSAAGGAIRDINGNWFQGCQQRVRKNFTLVYEAGYDESFEDCVFCDHIEGPFVIKTSEINGIKFNEKIKSQGLYEDLFLRLNAGESVICPDAMFYTNRTERSYNPKDWNSFVKTWPTYKIKFSGRDIIMPTPNIYSRTSGRGTAVTPWAQKENADVMHAVMDVCSGLNLTCEIDAGTIIGAVKMHGVLPWERDADVIFFSTNYSALANAKPTWEKMGYSVHCGNTVKCCWRNSSRPYHGFISVDSKHWPCQMWGMAFASSEPLLMEDQPPTKVLIDIKRVRGPRNPGLWGRNRYGPEIYKHSQHFLDAGDLKYRVKKFLKCEKPGAHYCLDRYNPDGNIQFRDPIP